MSITVEIAENLQPYQRRELIQIASHAHVIDGNCIGWLPTAVYENAAEQRRFCACHNNNDLVGYMLYMLRWDECRIYVTWVRRDARLMIHGKALVDFVNTAAWEAGLPTVGLWCAEDLEANLFWKALNFTYTSWRWGKAKKGRRHLQWQRPVQEPNTNGSPIQQPISHRTQPVPLVLMNQNLKPHRLRI